METILCVPKEAVANLFGNKKIIPYDVLQTKQLLSNKNCCFLPRPFAETNPDFKQIIPYCVFTHNGLVAVYKRTKNVGEARLREKFSIGFGGHVSLQKDTTCLFDYEMEDFGFDMANNGNEREFEEEVMLSEEDGDNYSVKGSFLIYDNDDEVGKVHLGIGSIIELKNQEIQSKEEELEIIGWFAPEEALTFNIESWSQFVCEMLLKQQMEKVA